MAALLPVPEVTTRSSIRLTSRRVATLTGWPTIGGSRWRRSVRSPFFIPATMYGRSGVASLGHTAPTHAALVGHPPPLPRQLDRGHRNALPEGYVSLGERAQAREGMEDAGVLP